METGPKDGWALLEGLLKVRLALAGAVASFLATTIAELPNVAIPFFPGWYGVFVVLTVASLYPAAVLLVAGPLRQIEVQRRLGPFFSFLGLTWLLLLALALKLDQYGPPPPFLQFFPVMVAGLLLAGAYFGLRWALNRTRHAPEQLFP